MPNADSLLVLSYRRCVRGCWGTTGSTCVFLARSKIGFKSCHCLTLMVSNRGEDVRASIRSRESNCFYAMARYRAAVHSLHLRPQIIIGTVSKLTAIQRQPERAIMLYRPIFAIQGLKHMAVSVPKPLRTNMTAMVASPITYRTYTVISLSPAQGMTIEIFYLHLCTSP